MFSLTLFFLSYSYSEQKRFRDYRENDKMNWNFVFLIKIDLEKIPKNSIAFNGTYKELIIGHMYVKTN